MAAPLVESGELTRYAPGGVTDDLVAMSYSMRHPEGVPFVAEEPVSEPNFTETIEPGAFKATRKRAPRKASED